MRDGVTAGLRAFAGRLRAQAKDARQRRMLVLAGDADWGRAQAEDVCRSLPLSPVSWISTAAPAGAEALSGRQALALLGQEREAVIFDAHSGFDPDVFGAVSGAVVGGGLLILLCPPLADWPDFADPAAERISIAPLTFADVSGRFLRRLARVLSTADGVSVIDQRAGSLPEMAADSVSAKACVIDADGFRSADQQAAVAALAHVVHGHRRRPVVLVADRGRGKTAALGIAAARLLRGGVKHIVVTAPRVDAVAPLFALAARQLPEAQCRRGRLQWQGACIEFRPPDDLLLNPIDTELLLVDEAAAIPAPLLTQLLERHSRIAFATTVHGYEGTGRGFALRFRRTLDERTPDWREVRLQTPIRWAAQDPVEAVVFRALLLDAAAASDVAVSSATAAKSEFVQFDRAALAADEASLSQVFGLLVQAHYRTRPNDLRNLLDGPGLSVVALRYAGQVVATALVSAEGGFDAEMAAAIAMGRRRPRGHLVPQSLAVHVGLADGARLRCARIMRIAVHPAAQRRGLGRHLVQQIRQRATANGDDLLAVSFGASEVLLDFWQCGQLLPVRLGFRRDHASGSHSAMLLRPLSGAGERVYRAARMQFLADFPLQLADPLRELAPGLAVRLLQRVVGETQLSAEGQAERATVTAQQAQDRQAVTAFAQGARSVDDVLAALYRQTLLMLGEVESPVSNATKDLLVAKLLQKRRWDVLAQQAGVVGRGAVIERLRAAAGELAASAVNDKRRQR